MATLGLFLGLAAADGCDCGGGGGGGGGCGVSNEEFCQNCLPGENVYGCAVASSNDRICAIDAATAVGLCPADSGAKLLAQCNNGQNQGTDGKAGGDDEEGKAEGAPPPGADETAAADQPPGNDQ